MLPRVLRSLVFAYAFEAQEVCHLISSSIENQQDVFWIQSLVESFPTVLGRNDWTSQFLVTAGQVGQLSTVDYFSQFEQLWTLQWEEALYAACKMGHLEVSQYIITRAVKIITWKILNQSLGVASKNRHWSIVVDLFTRGAEASFFDLSWLEFLTYDNDWDKIQFLTKKQVNIDFRTVCQACLVAPLSLLELLRIKDTRNKLEYRTAVRYAIMANRVDLLELFLSQDTRGDIMPIFNSLMPTSVFMNHLDTTRWLLEHKADVNYCCGLPLHVAIETNNNEAIKLLLEHKANVHK